MIGRMMRPSLHSSSPSIRIAKDGHDQGRASFHFDLFCSIVVTVIGRITFVIFIVLKKVFVFGKTRANIDSGGFKALAKFIRHPSSPTVSFAQESNVSNWTVLFFHLFHLLFLWFLQINTVLVNIILQVTILCCCFAISVGIKIKGADLHLIDNGRLGLSSLSYQKSNGKGDHQKSQHLRYSATAAAIHIDSCACACACFREDQSSR
mmetsp:Transcript_43576/g.105152  ORF Transcript_43576/g.105152 Transcript_43576/m.105152 type:complete len:207 (+) Transcript_43576:745-1365(+)